MLYHSEVYLPRFFKELNVKDCILGKITGHARREANSDRYGRINIPQRFSFDSSNIIEVETYDDTNDVKIVVRLPYNDTHDIVLVLLFSSYDNILKTVWLNDRNDIHKTLDRSRYAIS